MLELREIQCLIVLSERLHFGRTAEELNISQSRVSQLVRSAEGRIGACLFERSSREVRMSSLGAELIGRLRPLYEEMEQVYDDLVLLARGMCGALRLGVAGIELADWAKRLVGSFHEVYPECEVQLDYLPRGGFVSSLRRREVDVALARLPVHEPDLTVSRVLMREPRMLATSADHPLATCESVSVEEIAGETVLAFWTDAPDYWRDFHFPVATPAGARLRYRRTVARSSEWPCLLRSERSVAIVPELTARHLRSLGTRITPIVDLAATSMVLVWCTSEENARIRGFVERTQYALAES